MELFFRSCLILRLLPAHSQEGVLDLQIHSKTLGNESRLHSEFKQLFEMHKEKKIGCTSFLILCRKPAVALFDLNRYASKNQVRANRSGYVTVTIQASLTPWKSHLQWLFVFYSTAILPA